MSNIKLITKKQIRKLQERTLFFTIKAILSRNKSIDVVLTNDYELCLFRDYIDTEKWTLEVYVTDQNLKGENFSRRMFNNTGHQHQAITWFLTYLFKEATILHRKD